MVVVVVVVVFAVVVVVVVEFLVVVLNDEKIKIPLCASRKNEKLVFLIKTEIALVPRDSSIHSLQPFGNGVKK